MNINNVTVIFAQMFKLIETVKRAKLNTVRIDRSLQLRICIKSFNLVSNVIEGYLYELQYIRVKDNGVVDVLSHLSLLM